VQVVDIIPALTIDMRILVHKLIDNYTLPPTNPYAQVFTPLLQERGRGVRCKIFPPFFAFLK
jgi:hypothetical protein